MKKLFTLMALACMALGAQAQGKFALEAGSGAIPAGTQEKSVDNITLTFGFAGEADYLDPVADGTNEGYTAYTDGNGVNGREDGSSGTCYILEPQKNGEVTVAVYHKKKALYVLENGTALADYNGITTAVNRPMKYTFAVKAGKTYKVTCAGSKLGFYGFEYTVSDDQGGGGDDDPQVVIPENSEVYNAIVDGKLAAEFAAVAGENGGVANNAADGKSIITIKAGKAKVTAVGGTTPANADTGGQQITPGAVIDEEKHIYQVSSVAAWNDITWGKGNQGDIDFSWVTGTGNPYVELQAEEVYTDDAPTGNYRANYIYYNPDGSLGLPITGLYYTFTASAQGAFKVKVWANKGNRFTYVVNANTKQAERLFASGYINGVNDADGKKKFLSVEQVDSVHHDWIYSEYEAAVAAGAKTEDELAEMKATADANAEAWQYVIGRGNQNFFGWLTFDVEPGEEYWVFQHSSQIGFGGFEFHEGITAEELIQGIEPAYVFTTNFSTYEDAETGERVTWKGEQAMGNGRFASEKYDADTYKEATAVQTTYYPGGETAERALEEIIFSDYFQGNGGTVRASYCLLPEDVLAHSANTQALSLGVWMKAPKDDDADSYKGAPLLTAYDQKKADNGAPLFALQYDGTVALNNGTQCDYTAEQNVAGSNTVCSGANDWLADKKWHYYTAVFNGETAQVFIDGQLKNEWNCGSAQTGLFANGADLKYVVLGGNQVGSASEADSFDAPFAFARLFIKNSSMTPGEIKAQMTVDFPEHEAYWAKTDEPEVKKGDVNGDSAVDVADISAIITVMATGSNDAAADVNKDGAVDVADISSVITIMAGGE